MPNLTFDTLELIPEGLKEHAKQVDGKFIVDVVPGAKLVEFRENNITASRQRDEALAVLAKLKPVVGEDVDTFVTKFGELNTIAQQVKDGKLQGTDAIEAEVVNRVGAMKTGFETQLQEAARKAAEAETRASTSDLKWRRSIVARAVTEAVIDESSGANPSALGDILTRAYGVFQVSDDDKLVAKDGEAVIYGSDGATPMTPKEWLASIRKNAGHLFKGSNGGGASGGTSGAGQFGGLTQEAFAKLSPMAKLDLAHKQKLAAKR
jgi:hypothetical protein